MKYIATILFTLFTANLFAAGKIVSSNTAERHYTFIEKSENDVQCADRADWWNTTNYKLRDYSPMNSNAGVWDTSKSHLSQSDFGAESGGAVSIDPKILYRVSPSCDYGIIVPMQSGTLGNRVSAQKMEDSKELDLDALKKHMLKLKSDLSGLSGLDVNSGEALRDMQLPNLPSRQLQLADSVLRNFKLDIPKNLNQNK